MTSSKPSYKPIPLKPITSQKSSPSEIYTDAQNKNTTSDMVILNTQLTFCPTQTLQIQTRGKQPISLPLPTKQLTTPIFSIIPSSPQPIYLSIRPTRRSGSCYLVDAEDETETSIATTTYRFGPGKSPVIKIGRDDDITADAFEMKGKKLCSRTVTFESRRWGRFEWRYARRSERKMISDKVSNLLVLEKVGLGDCGKEERVRVAQLIRGEETRTPSTGKCHAGNGGRLEMMLGEKWETLVDEVTVLVTCLVMLKKEVDRLRTGQILMISGAASGGGC